MNLNAAKERAVPLVARTILSPRKARRRPRGSAIVELAVCLPAIVVLVLGSIETCTMIFVKQSLHVAAYEAIRRAIEPGAVPEDVLDHAHEILTQRHIKGADVEFEPANFDNVQRGQDIAVRIAVPIAQNSIINFGIARSDLQAEATMVKE